MRGVYGWNIRDSILSTRILQESGRHLKVKCGDVLIYSKSKSEADYMKFAEKTYFSHTWQHLKVDDIRSTYLTATIYTWVIENIDQKTALTLHAALLKDDAYLGMHGVDLTNPAHLIFYHNSLIAMYRISGNSIRIFYPMGNRDGIDEGEADELKIHGFESIDWEDRGAHGTIFDDFDTPIHFLRVEAFRKLAAANLPEGQDGADELTLMLEDLSPRLLVTLGVVSKAFWAATHEEEFAQVGVSCRRYIEQLADVLFSGCDEKYKGMDVTNAEFKNRILAYIDKAMPSHVADKGGQWDGLRVELNALIDDVNKAIHGEIDGSHIGQVVSNLAKFSLVLLQLNPEYARKPYYAFSKSIMEFWKEVQGQSKGK